jgi:hypothetical protein
MSTRYKCIFWSNNKKSKFNLIPFSNNQSSASKTKYSPVACFMPVFLAADNPEFD